MRFPILTFCAALLVLPPAGAIHAEDQPQIDCSEQALNKADEELNSIYKQAVKAAAALDETVKNTVGYEARGGTMLGSLLMDCKKDMTDGRIKELNALIKGFEEE